MPTPRQTSRLLIDESPLQLLPSLACAIGLTEAVLLQQMHYWLHHVDPAKHVHGGRIWIYNSYADWHKQLPFLSAGTVRRTMERLETRGLVLVDNFNDSPLDRTKWYTIDYGALDALLEAPPPFGKNDKCSGENARPCDQSDPSMCADCADASDQIARVIPIDSPQETNTKEGVVEEDQPPAPAPQMLPPPPPPPVMLAQNDDGPARDLVALAQAEFRAQHPARASPGQLKRIARDVGRARANHLPLTARGLEHALGEAAGKTDPWEFAIKVWRAKPDGPPTEGGTHDRRSLGAGQPGAPGEAGQPARPAAPGPGDRAALDRANERLTRALGRPLAGPGGPGG